MKIFKKNTYSTDILLVFLLFAIATVLRVTHLSTIPPGIYGDEAEFGLINNRILSGTHNSLLAVADQGIFSYPIISFLPQVWIYNLFGKSIFSLRLSSAFVGAASVIPFYFLVKSLTDRKTAFFSSLFMATSALLISYSRLAVNNIYPPFFLILTFLFLFWGIKSGKKVFFVLSGLVTGGGLYSYHPFKIVPAIILSLFLINLGQKEFRKKYLWKFIWLFSFALLVFLPQAIHYISRPADLTTRPGNILIFESFKPNVLIEKRNQYLSNVVKNILVFPLGKDDGYFVYGITKFGLFSPFLIIFLLIGVGGAIKKIKDIRWQFVFAGIIFTILATSATVSCPASHRLLVATPLLLLLSGYGLKLITDLLPRQARILSVIVVSLVLVANSYWDFSVYFKYYINSTDGWAQREPATQVAYYLKSLGPAYYTYMLREGTVLYFNHGTIKFLNPNIRGEDVDDSLNLSSLKPVKGKNLVFLMPPNSLSLDRLKKTYPQGKIRNFTNPRNNQPSFTSYEIIFQPSF